MADYADATANLAMTCRILAFKSNIELKGDQVQYLQCKFGQLALENKKEGGTSAKQLLAYLDSCEDISYLCVFDKVESRSFWSATFVSSLPRREAAFVFSQRKGHKQS
jgi:hypothetical protein